MTDLRPVCEDYDPRVWFPARTDRRANAYAVAICGTCPLRASCLEGALQRREAYGIYGGVTEAERARMLGGAG